MPRPGGVVRAERAGFDAESVVFIDDCRDMLEDSAKGLVVGAFDFPDRLKVIVVIALQARMYSSGGSRLTV
jgi:hypothetical protein